MTHNIIGWDTETHLITPETPFPPVVCYTFNGGPDTLDLLEEWVNGLAPGVDAQSTFADNGNWTLIIRRGEMREDIEAVISLILLAHERDVILAAHNLDYDANVLVANDVLTDELALDLINDGTLACTSVREQLIAIAEDNFKLDRRINKPNHWGLGQCVRARFGDEFADPLDRDKSKVKWDPKRRVHEVVKGNPNAWRHRYQELQYTPLVEWPEEAVTYAVEDALWARELWISQSKPLSFSEGVVVMDGKVTDEVYQTAAAFSLAKVSAVGVQTDPWAVARFRSRVEKEVEQIHVHARNMGFLRVNKCKECEGTGMTGEVPALRPCTTCHGDPNYLPPRARVPLRKVSKHTARLQSWVSYAFGYAPPMTARSEKFPRGQVKTDADTLMVSGHDGLMAYAESLGAEKLLNTYVPVLETGVMEAIHPSFYVLVRSGRTSCRDPNYQNPPAVKGFRECHIAPKGMVFASLDYSTVELRTQAQVLLDLFGASRLAEAFQEGQDPHTAFGLHIMRAETGEAPSYDEAVAIRKDPGHELYKTLKHYRDLAKVANFGFWGGMGAKGFVGYARGYGVVLSIDEATRLKSLWMEMWVEATDYFNLIGEAADRGIEGRFRLRQPRSGRVRGGCSYTSACNTVFQGTAADGIKRALVALIREMYVNEDSPLYGVRAWNVIHDEVLFVGPRDTAHEWAHAAAKIMEDVMRESMSPDIPQIVEPALMRRWSKEAWTYYDNQGRLTPYEEDPRYGS